MDESERDPPMNPSGPFGSPSAPRRQSKKPPAPPWNPRGRATRNCGIGRPVKSRSGRLEIRFESDLEDYLVLHLPLHLANLGLDLLIIGRQVKVPPAGVIDLLGIDATGTIYIIELKVHLADPETIAQVLDYFGSIRRMTKQELKHATATGRIRVNWEAAFQRHFGFPIPETLNQSQKLMVIASSFDPRTARTLLVVQSLLQLKEEGCRVLAFHYLVDSHELSLVPLNLEERYLEPYAVAPTRGRRPSSTPRSPVQLQRYKVRIDVERFWLTHAPDFISPVALFRPVYELYERWVRPQLAEGDEPLQAGQFGRQLAAFVAASGEWTRVFLPPETKVELYEPLVDLPSIRPRFGPSHPLVAYLRNTADRKGDGSSEGS